MKSISALLLFFHCWRLLIFLYLLPLFWEHDICLVSRNQFPQHSGDHDKLRPVWIHFDSEEQPTQVDHVLFGAIVVSPQVLRQLLWCGCKTDNLYHNDCVWWKGIKIISRVKLCVLDWLDTCGKWKVRSATSSFPGVTLNQSFLLNITR